MSKKVVSEGEYLDWLISSIVSNIKAESQMSIVDFAHDIVFNGDSDVQLYPTQRALLKAFYNEPLKEDEREILKEWLKDDKTSWVEGRRYNNLILQCGRRGGKSTLASIIALKEFYDLITLDSPAKTYGLLPSSPIAIMVVAQSADQVKETIFAAIKGYAENSYFFKGLKENGTIEILGTEIRCPSKNVAIYAKPTRTQSLVGFSLKLLLLDEAARFETSEETGTNLALEVFDNVGKGCSMHTTPIVTTYGTMSVGSLLQCTNNMSQAEYTKLVTTEGTRKNDWLLRNRGKSNNIGLVTYNLETGKQEISYDYTTWFNGVEPVIELKTKSGRKEVCTYEHPFLVWYPDKTKPEWVALENIKEGDVLAVAKKHNIFGDSKVGIKRAKLIGYLTGDGCVTGVGVYGHQRNIGFTNTDPQILVDLQKILDDEFAGAKIVKADNSRDFQYRINHRDTELKVWLRQMQFDKKSISKVMPDCVKQGSKEEIGAYINGLWSTDGSIPLFGEANKTRLSLELGMSNLTLLEEVQKELIKFGIYSAIRKKRTSHTWKGEKKYSTTYVLSIFDKESILIFCNEIGVTGEKELNLERVKQAALVRRDNLTKSEINFMPIGAIHRINEIRKEEKLSWNKLAKEATQLNINSFDLKRRPTVYSTLKLATYLQDEFLIRYCNSDIRWEEVKSVTRWENPQATIAIEIPNTHIIGNDIISHNCAAFGKDGRKVVISSAWEKGDPIEILCERAYKDFQSLAFNLTTFQLNLGLKKGITPIIVSDYTQDPIKARLEYENIRYSKHNTFIPKENLEKALIGTTCVDAQPTDIDIETNGDKRHYVGIEILRLEKADLSQVSFIHVDPALKKDSAALAIASPYKFPDGKWGVQVDGLLKWEPHVDSNGRKRLVSFVDIEEKLFTLAEARNVRQVSFDAWNSASLIQRLHQEGISTIEMSVTRDMQIIYYTLFRDLLSHNLVSLPKDSLWSGEIVTELSELVMKPNKSIVHPYAGKDLADAVVNAVYNCFKYMTDTGLCTGIASGVSTIKSSTLARVNTKSATKRLVVGNAISKLRSMRT